jgi:Domain of unknown function (DUF4331)
MKLSQTPKWLAALSVAALLTASPDFVSASDHRESAAMYEDPAADIADFYAFLSPNDPSKLVMAMTVNALASPTSPESYEFSKHVLYTFNIDTDGDAVADETIQFRFGGSGEVRNQKIAALFPKRILHRGEATFTPAFAKESPAPVINDVAPGIKYFAGLRDDPFFFDIVAAFRSFQGEKFSTAIDRFAGLNVSAIVVEVPLTLLSKHQFTKLQIWGDTKRQIDGKWTQIQRVGNPAVKPIFIPANLKDQYNRTLPHDDAKLYSAVLRDAVKTKLGQTDDIAELVLKQLAPDTLKLDPTKPSKWPNGRTLDEDSIDLVFSYNLYKSFVYAPGDLDGVHHNDVPFLSTFPYLAPPHINP